MRKTTTSKVKTLTRHDRERMIEALDYALRFDVMPRDEARRGFLTARRWEWLSRLRTAIAEGRV